MKRKTVEDRINKVFSDSVPDVLDNILKVCEEKKGFDYDMKKYKITEKKSSRFRLYNFIGVGAVACVAIIGFINLYNNDRVESVIGFDVNPSVELKVNKNERVIDVDALNKDGEVILKDMDFENVDLDVVVNALIGSMVKNGFLTVDENSILVSVKSNNSDKEVELKNNITKEVNSILKSVSIDGSILSQTLDDNKKIEKLADKYDISIGKAKLVSDVVDSGLTNSKGEVYNEESLVKLSINELNLLLTSKNANISDVTYNGVSASEKSYIGNDKAKEIALDNAKLSSSDAFGLEVEFDCDNGKLVYEVDFESKNKDYEYEIDAKTGNIIKKDVEIDD